MHYTSTTRSSTGPEPSNETTGPPRSYLSGPCAELCTRFGPIGGIIFDGYWPRASFKARRTGLLPSARRVDLAGTYDLIHSLQPDAVICNNTTYCL